MWTEQETAKKREKEGAAGLIGLLQRVGGFEKNLVGLGGHQTPVHIRAGLND